ncbi:hypothetical protein ARAM_003748 [Aspergillus rambellii]|uniref:cAMP-specific phosphodiesterase n=1 Tax=Aspergillus rambellii TaxID=308745 RepID=A0A0F8V577_9EURO|nr:hypothetical protein ARAM_003748 [Aspergillus rambellii]
MAQTDPTRAGAEARTEDDSREAKARNAKSGIQVIVLGPTGGPREDRVTGILVRSVAAGWSSNSMIAVDAGTLLCGIINALTGCDNKDGVVTSGPFAGLPLPHKTIPSNAAYVFQKIIGAVLITHPHLDHVSALAINTPVLEAGSGPKTVAALPSVVAAIKNHIFNDVIWPNLSDEDGGAGFITYQRLVEGGNPMMGRGDERGYVRASEGLLARCFCVSHGRCKQKYYPETEGFHRASSVAFSADRHRLSTDTSEMGYPRSLSDMIRSPFSSKESWSSVESSAFFIRDQQTGTEIIIFGDVEPDSISLDPRNKRIWDLAAPKVVSHQLRAIFIECSYSDDTDDDYLFGHLCPRHLVEELGVLARLVAEAKGQTILAGEKRKRLSDAAVSTTEPVSPKSKRGLVTKPSHQSRQPTRRTTRHSSKINEGDPLAPAGSVDPHALRRELDIAKRSDPSSNSPGSELPLKGLSIYIIHIKDDMTDGPHPSEKILQELNEQGEKAGLGCEFHVPRQGESIYL